VRGDPVVSQLRVYDNNSDENLVRIGPEGGAFKPGDIVSTHDRSSAWGIVVAIDEHHVTVLWSKEPPAFMLVDASKMMNDMMATINRAFEPLNDMAFEMNKTFVAMGEELSRALLKVYK
jgi:hypothetical protein